MTVGEVAGIISGAASIGETWLRSNYTLAFADGSRFPSLCPYSFPLFSYGRSGTNNWTLRLGQLQRRLSRELSGPWFCGPIALVLSLWLVELMLLLQHSLSPLFCNSRFTLSPHCPLFSKYSPETILPQCRSSMLLTWRFSGKELLHDPRSHLVGLVEPRLSQIVHHLMSCLRSSPPGVLGQPSQVQKIFNSGTCFFTRIKAPTMSK